jgi:hypothetical protein
MDEDVPFLNEGENLFEHGFGDAVFEFDCLDAIAQYFPNDFRPAVANLRTQGCG